MESISTTSEYQNTHIPALESVRSAKIYKQSFGIHGFIRKSNFPNQPHRPNYWECCIILPISSVLSHTETRTIYTLTHRSHVVWFNAKLSIGFHYYAENKKKEQRQQLGTQYTHITLRNDARVYFVCVLSVKTQLTVAYNTVAFVFTVCTEAYTLRFIRRVFSNKLQFEMENFSENLESDEFVDKLLIECVKPHPSLYNTDIYSAEDEHKWDEFQKLFGMQSEYHIIFLLS